MHYQSILKLIILSFILFGNFTSVYSYEAYYRNDSFTMAYEAQDPYYKNIQPILDKRCVVCHACREAECGLKLTSPDGFERGGTKKETVGRGLLPVKRSKLFHDAKTIAEWRKKGFYSVTTAPKYILREHGSNYEILPKSSILSAALINKFDPNHIPSSKDFLTEKDKSCGIGNKDLNQVPAMPYNMAQLNMEKEFNPLYQWSKGDTRYGFPSLFINNLLETPNKPEIVKKWENFFNASTNKAKWTSRFLYEHLFLARFYIDESPGEFFELVRSSTAYPEKINIIPTLKAFDKPAGSKFYYRLMKVRSTIVNKNHFVYQVNNKTLSNLKELFWNVNWGVENNNVPFSFKNSNPLVAFKHVPAKSRYTWMLNNAHLLLDISARSQNCRSTAAGSPYWDNMLHIFLKPEADPTVVFGKKYYDEAGKYLRIPFTTKGQHNPFAKFKKDQKRYGKIKIRHLNALRPNGFTYNDLWKGKDDKNKNAMVTVLRHEWTAAAYKGQVGTTPRSVLLLDFANWERYFYLCNVATEVSEAMIFQAAVVNYLFDVKKESEDQFLSFIPENYRLKIRKNLVQGFNVYKEFEAPFAHKFNRNIDSIEVSPFNTYSNFINKFLQHNYSEDIIGKHSTVNPHSEKSRDLTTKTLQDLRFFRSFVSFMPNVSYVLVKDGNETSYYSLLPNRYYKSRNKLSKLGNDKYEKTTRVPSLDIMEVYEGIFANFPEKIYIVNKSELKEFVEEMINISSRSMLLKFNRKFGLDQMSSDFWPAIDEINSYYISTNPITGGILDLHKYGIIDKKEPL